MKNFWRDKKVLVTGGAGFIGSYVVEQLVEKGSRVSVTTKSGNLENLNSVKRKIKVFKGDLSDFKFATHAVGGNEVVLNLASKVAGIEYNMKHPAEMFMENVQIAKNVIEASMVNRVERFLITSSACVYPGNSTIPTPESEGFLDDPEPTNMGYGWAKRVAELMGRFYMMEHGMKIAIARPYNAYGPRDNFDPKYSHVIPGIIKRVFDGENPLVVWGSGKQTRSFLFATDFAKGLIEVTENYANGDPINIGSSEEVTIADLARMIVELSGLKVKIVFDKTKPDGQPRRACDTTKAKKMIRFEAKVSLKDGLERTIQWYKQRL